MASDLVEHSFFELEYCLYYWSVNDKVCFWRGLKRVKSKNKQITVIASPRGLKKN